MDCELTMNQTFKRTPYDIAATDHGTILHLRFASQVAKKWRDDNVRANPDYTGRRYAFHADHRAALQILAGAQVDGLTVYVS